MSHMDDLCSVFAGIINGVFDDNADDQDLPGIDQIGGRYVFKDDELLLGPGQNLPSTSAAKREEPEVYTAIEDIGVRRKAIIDVANVMHLVKDASVHANPSGNNLPDAYGILNLVHYFTTQEFDAELVMPKSYFGYKNAWILSRFQRLGLVTISKGMNDDRVALELARCTGGFIVSNDKYRDHLDKQNFQEIIKSRLISFDVQKINVDPRQIPILGDNEKGKYFTGFALTLNVSKMEILFCQPNDPMFEIVAHVRSRRTQTKAQALITELSVMGDYVQQEICQLYGVPPPRLTYFDPRIQSLGYYEEFRRHADRQGFFRPATVEELFEEAKRLYS